MKIERNVHNVDSGEVFYVEERHGHAPASEKSKQRIRRITPYVITAIVVAAITAGVVMHQRPRHFDLQFALQATTGKIALTERQLRDVVVGEGLNVYWLGPEEGARYVFNSISATQNYVRYLPGGAGLNDFGANFRVVGTYEARNAFLITQKEAKLANGVGFINVDGNVVYYNAVHPLSAYVGLKNTDVQIEIFDPVAEEALIAARTHGSIQKIR